MVQGSYVSGRGVAVQDARPGSAGRRDCRSVGLRGGSRQRSGFPWSIAEPAGEEVGFPHSCRLDDPSTPRPKKDPLELPDDLANNGGGQHPIPTDSSFIWAACPSGGFRVQIASGHG